MKLKNLLISFFILNGYLNVSAQWEIQNIDANNINAPVEADGFLFHNNTTNASFEVPKFSGKYCIYASNLWMGGLDQNGILHVSAQTYKQNGTDYWPGPLTGNGGTLPPSTWNKIWHINRSAIDNHISNYNTQGYQMPQDINEWPGSSFNGINQIFAPFADVNNNGIYDPSYGDYPNVLGDEILYLMYNDKYGAHTESGGIPIDAEIYTSVYVYNNTGSVNLDNTVFVRHRIRNRSQTNTYNNFYVGIWNDFDIGNITDDLIGTDINRNMVYGYNATNHDSIYGNKPPAVGMKILNHPLNNSMFYDNNGSSSYNNNPSNANHYYNYLRSIWKDGAMLNFGQEGYQTGLGNTNYCFSGNTNPNFSPTWEMTSAKDYRIIGTAGPFTIIPNGYITIDVAYIYAKGNSDNNLPELGIAADVVQNFYNATINAVSTIEDKNYLQIFPNPAQDFVTINFAKSMQQPAIIEICDLMGCIIAQEKLDVNGSINLNISKLQAGVYFIQIKNGNNVVTRKLVKN